MKNKILMGLIFVVSFCSCLGFVEGAPFTPESVLPAGVDLNVSMNPYTGESGPARKGTIAAMLNNVARLNWLTLQEESKQNKEEILEISAAIDELITPLQWIGMFDLFEPIHWMGDGEQPGRVLVIALYFKNNPEKCTPALREQLDKIKDQMTASCLREQVEVALLSFSKIS